MELIECNCAMCKTFGEMKRKMKEAYLSFGEMKKNIKEAYLTSSYCPSIALLITFNWILWSLTFALLITFHWILWSLTYWLSK